MARGLKTLGIDARETPDGIVIRGGAVRGGAVDSHGDHRIAMAFAIAALRANGAVTVRDCKERGYLVSRLRRPCPPRRVGH